jgi:hypothetical protein
MTRNKGLAIPGGYPIRVPQRALVLPDRIEPYLIEMTPQLTYHLAIFCKSSVKVENTRTGCSFWSDGTATKISLAPISVPAAFGSSMGRSSRHIPFCLRPRLPLPAWVLCSAGFAGCFFCLDVRLAPFAQIEAKSRSGALLTGISLGTAAGCNHCMAHETWDNAFDRA